MYSILHISDLHRSTEEPVDNDSLLAVLLADRDRYTTGATSVPSPQAIVVSGDLIQGVAIDTVDWQQRISDQYATADGFLSSLCDRFLGGDRSRMVIVPGNHDVCWNTAVKSMSAVPEEEYPDDIHAALVTPESTYRWSWSDRALFYVADNELYEKRLDAYWTFVETFYKDANLPYSIDRERGFQIFEFCDRQIVMLAFDSICRNDCFNLSGEIPRGAIGRCAMTLRDCGRAYDLKIAVWHHSIQGPPSRSDYVDVTQIQEMAGHDIHLGLHGHQHIAETQTKYVHLDQSRSMAVVSAGSLCAGNRNLPRGVNRQYNIIVIEEEFTSARVHVREMAEGSQFVSKQDGAFAGGFAEVNWQPSINMVGQKIDAQVLNNNQDIAHAEAALQRNRPNEVVEVLGHIDISIPSNAYARTLILQALEQLGDWPRITGLLINPQNVEETVILIRALIETGELALAQTKLNAAYSVDDATRIAIQERITVQKMMR